MQQTVEQALSKVCNMPTTVFASGRTDVGVHALGQVVHTDLPVDRTPKDIMRGCNHFLPHSIRVVNAEQVDDDFHARHSAKSKTYTFKFYLGQQSALLVDRAMHVDSASFDIEQMQKACQMMVGKHDFGSFVGAGALFHTSVRNVLDCKITQEHCTFSNRQIVSLTITSQGFLYNMVRIISGLVYNVGISKKTLQDVEQALSNTSRKHTNLVAPACGLYLVGVEY